jgi:hypothetical protein
MNLMVDSALSRRSRRTDCHCILFLHHLSLTHSQKFLQDLARIQLSQMVPWLPKKAEQRSVNVFAGL